MLDWLVQHCNKPDPKTPRDISADFKAQSKALIDSQNWNKLFLLGMNTMFSQARTWDAYHAEKAFLDLISDPVKSAKLKWPKPAGGQVDNSLQQMFMVNMMLGAGNAGDDVAFNALFRIVDESAQMTAVGFAESVWIRIFSDNKKLNDPKGAAAIVEKYGAKFKDDLESQLSIAAAYVVNGQMSRAAQSFKKIDKQRAEWGWGDKYGRVKDLIKQ